MAEDKYGDLKMALRTEFEKVVGVANEAEDRLLIMVTEALTTKERDELNARIKRTNPEVDYRVMVAGTFRPCS
jgi:hypothetical protein